MAKKKTRYNKRSNVDRTIKKCVAGFWMRWSSEDPLGDHDKLHTVQVGSTNPIINIRLRNDSFWNAMRQVLHHNRFKWSIEVSMEFKNGDKTEFKAREMVGVGRLPDLDDHYQGMVEDLFKDAEDKNYLDKYVNTHVFQEVLQGEVIKDSDFSETA